MEQWNKHQVIMIPTKEDGYKVKQIILTTYGVNKGKLRLAPWTDEKGEISILQGQHLAILSDDEIEKGDWFIDITDNTLWKNEDNVMNKHLFPECKKIIATTNTSLTKGTWIDEETGKTENKPLPQPSQQFIEKYIEAYNAGKPITDVLVKYEEYGNELGCDPAYYGLPELRLKVNPKDNTITIKKLKDSWNREEVIELIRKYSNEMSGAPWFEEDEIWLKQNL